MRLLIPAMCAACSGAVAVSAIPQTVFRARTDVVVIDAAVTRRGRPVGLLTADDFTVRDNGVVQRLLDFDRVVRPIDLTVTIDISGSMDESDRRIVENAVASVSRMLTAADRISVVTFGRHIAEQVPLGRPPVTTDISATGDGSAVLDALLLSLVSTRTPDRRLFHMFMTDGQDNTSTFDADTVIETAKYSAGPTSIVLVPNRATDRFLGVLRAIASITGGQMFALEGRGELSAAFLAGLDNFRTSYVLRYTPSGVEPGGWHDLSVSIAEHGYDVRARRGYWGG